MNFYKRYIGDYARDTGHLSMLEHGAYTLLLDAFYGTKRPLPGNKLALYRLVRANTKRERDATDSVLAQFWTLQDGNWLNRRALSEIDKATSQAETNQRIATERETNRSTNRDTNRGTNRSTNSQPNHSHSQKPEARSQTPEAVISTEPSRSVVKEKKEKVSSHTTDRPTKNGYRPTLKDARELQDLMLRTTGRAETDETTLGWLRTTNSAESFQQVKQVLNRKLSKHKPVSNAWFKTVLKQQFGASPAEAEAQRKDLVERYRKAIMIEDHKERAIEASWLLEEAKNCGITLIGTPFA